MKSALDDFEPLIVARAALNPVNDSVFRRHAPRPPT
jgi:hypothetical protein